MGDKIRFQKGDLNDEYVPSDSEDEYTQTEKNLLSKALRKPAKNFDSEDEVLGFSHSDSDNDGPQNADSDIDDGDEDLPDSRAWGKNRGIFHSTDYVDKDYGGFTGREEEVAEQEEKEARELQERLAKQLDEADFSLDFFSKRQEADSEVEEEETVVKTDLSDLSKRQKLQLFQKESPEFSGLVSDFKERLELLQSCLEPIMDLSRKGLLPDCTAMEFISTQYHLVLNYCVNVSFYILLKSKRIAVQNHPVIKRLYQYRQLLTQLQPTYDEVIEPQIKKILQLVSEDKLQEITNTSEIQKPSIKKTKKLNLLSLKNANNDSKISNEESGSESEYDDEDMEVEKTQKEGKDIGKGPTNKLLASAASSESEDNEENMEVEETQNEGEEVGKRRITYQIAKNKGLTPCRKKEQRNPRVKHRNKFRKAKIRRKGAIREVRTEKSRYGGELSGIKLNVKKSVKLS